MDIIEELKLDDVSLIDKYFSDELSQEEKKAFKKRLKKDKKLKEDYLMIKKTYYQNNEHWLEQENITLEQIRLRSRNLTGKALIKYGLWMLLLMGIVIVSSAFVLLIFSD